MGDDRGYWERVARGYDRSMWLLGGPLPAMSERVAARARGASRALEVAAGTGLVTAALAREVDALIATDYAANMVDALRSRMAREGRDGVRCEQADLYALPYEPGSFDVVVAANVLHLVPELDRALGALAAMVRPGGALVVPTFCHAQTRRSRLVSRVMALTGFPGQRRFTLETLREAVERAGLKVGRAEVLPGLLPIGYVEATREDVRASDGER